MTLDEVGYLLTGLSAGSYLTQKLIEWGHRQTKRKATKIIATSMRAYRMHQHGTDINGKVIDMYVYNEKTGYPTGYGSVGAERKLRDSTSEFLNISMSYGLKADVATVNNRKIGKYQQKTPKARVIALLKDMVTAGV